MIILKHGIYAIIVSLGFEKEQFINRFFYILTEMHSQHVYIAPKFQLSPAASFHGGGGGCFLKEEEPDSFADAM